jgi:penicillin-insensitive murein endopeptidase
MLMRTALSSFWPVLSRPASLKRRTSGHAQSEAAAALANPDAPGVPAKELFGRAREGAPLEARSLGFYSRGCLAGGAALPVDGPAWQVMRLSRNRNWGHPSLIDVPRKIREEGARCRLERAAGRRHLAAARRADADRPRLAPDRPRRRHLADADAATARLSRARARGNVGHQCGAPRLARRRPEVWTRGISPSSAAAQGPACERIFVNAAIKKALCREAGGDRSWLSKVRPMYGHNYHFHIRMACPGGDNSCTPQDPAGPARAATPRSPIGSATPCCIPSPAPRRRRSRSRR